MLEFYWEMTDQYNNENPEISNENLNSNWWNLYKLWINRSVDETAKK